MEIINPAKEMHRILTDKLASWRDDGEDHLPLGWGPEAGEAAKASIREYQETEKALKRAQIPGGESIEGVSRLLDLTVHIVNVGPWDFWQHVGSWGNYHIPPFGSVAIPGYLHEPGAPAWRGQNMGVPVRIEGYAIAEAVIGSAGQSIDKYGVFICSHLGPLDPTADELAKARRTLCDTCIDLASDTIKEIAHGTYDYSFPESALVNPQRTAINYLASSDWPLKPLYQHLKDTMYGRAK